MATVQLVEDGDWITPSWSNNPDDEEFIETGWKVVTYEGAQLFWHNALAPVERWLREHGYVDTGDGAHYSNDAARYNREMDERSRIVRENQPKPWLPFIDGE